MTNDELIMALRKKIDDKKALLVKIERFVPVTNCMLELYGKQYNLHTLTKQTVSLLLVTLKTLENTSKELEIKLEVSGYALSSWITDLKAKLAHLSVDEEKQKLKAMEKRLYELLSPDKKVELEISEIMSELE